MPSEPSTEAGRRMLAHPTLAFDPLSEQIRAIESGARSLDAERLARAMGQVHWTEYTYRADDDFEELARLIAAEYAALTDTPE